MHDLDTLIALNKRATERCEKCGTARIAVESRTPRDCLSVYRVDDREQLLCMACVTEGK